MSIEFKKGFSKGIGFLSGLIAITLLTACSYIVDEAHKKTSLYSRLYPPSFHASNAREFIGSHYLSCVRLKRNGKSNVEENIPIFGSKIELVEAINKSSPFYIYKSLDSCKGTLQRQIVALSKDMSKFPTYYINVDTGEMTCSHDGPNEFLLDCNARRDGIWKYPWKLDNAGFQIPDK